LLYREELISYYKQLSDAAELRATKAQWRVRRRRLDERRTQWLQSASSWDSEIDDAAVEVMWIYCNNYDSIV